MECTQLVDLIFFMGQSNMAGRGDAALAPAVIPGMGFEYRAVTDPAHLHPLAEPFGVNENDPAGVNEPGMKTGSMVSAFVNACTAQTGIAVVGVSCAKGGSAIAEWLAQYLTDFGFDRALYTYEAEGFAPYRERYKALCVNLGRRVTYDGGAGVATDVDTDGRLIVHDERGDTRVFTGEVSVRGIYGAV